MGKNQLLRKLPVFAPLARKIDRLEDERESLHRTISDLQVVLAQKDQHAEVLQAGLNLLQNARNKAEGLYANSRPPGEQRGAGDELFADVKIVADAVGAPRFEKFPYAGPFPWLDQPDADFQIKARLAAGLIDEAEAEGCRYWKENGYLILKQAVEPELLDEVWAAYETAIADGTVQLKPEEAGPGDPFPGRFLDPHLKVPAFCRVLRHPAILHWIGLLMDREPAPFQTITSHKGSQQGEHSDSIHMTTYPIGYLTACWTAFEDIHPDCGPLVYYPGSHRLPYVFSQDVGITEDEFQRRGYHPYHERYEPRIKELLAEHKMAPQYFHAEKGDVLIWHANLIHGGSPRRDLRRSRRALVNHYFVKGALCYHDLAAAKPKPFSGTCLLRPQVETHASAPHDADAPVAAGAQAMS